MDGGPKLIFAWTPPNSYRGVGSIALPEKPANGLDWTTYKHALAARIDRMIENLCDHEARELLTIVEERDHLTLPPAPPAPEGEEDFGREVTFSGFGLLMVENSGWLQDRMGGWPSGTIPAHQLRHDPDRQAALEDEVLEDYLNTLYSEAGGW